MINVWHKLMPVTIIVINSAIIIIIYLHKNKKHAGHGPCLSNKTNIGEVVDKKNTQIRVGRQTLIEDVYFSSSSQVSRLHTRIVWSLPADSMCIPNG